MTETLTDPVDSSEIALRKGLGKKLLWVCKDSEQQIVYLVFEGGYTVAVQEASEILDGPAFCERFLQEHLQAATNVIALQGILGAIAPPPPPALEVVVDANRAAFKEADEALAEIERLDNIEIEMRLLKGGDDV